MTKNRHTQKKHHTFWSAAGARGAPHDPDHKIGIMVIQDVLAIIAPVLNCRGSRSISNTHTVCTAHGRIGAFHYSGELADNDE